jgi:nitrite reductase/ring-hydroxylating ferredoxin subunit
MSSSSAAAAGGATLRQPQTIASYAAYPAAPSPAHTAVAPVADIAQGISGFQGSSVVIVRRGEAFWALGGLCPHKQGELALGDLAEDIEDAGGAPSVLCPRHRVKFPGGLHISCATGAASCPKGAPQVPVEAGWRVPLYATSVAGGWLFIQEASAGRAPGGQGCGGDGKSSCAI